MKRAAFILAKILSIRLKVSAGLLASLLFVIPASVANGGQANAVNESAISAALRAKDYDRALQLARSILKQSPNDPKVLTLEGLALVGLGKSDEALAAYDAALKASPDYLPALEGASQIEYAAGNARAFTLLNRILKIRPDDPTSHAMLGALFYKRHDCKEAVAHFRASGELVFSQRAAVEEYGYCLMSLGEAKDAIALYQTVLSQNPEDEAARLHLAVAQTAAEQPDDAIATLQPLLSRAEANPEALDLASTAYEKKGDTPKATELLRQAIVQDPDNPKLYLDFSTLCFDHSSFQVGIDMLNAGLTRLPNSAPLYLARGILYIQLAMYDKGEADFEAAERLDPRQTFSSESESLAKLQENRGEDTLASVRVQLRAHPNDAMLLYLYADALTRGGAQPGSAEFTQALISARRAVALKPDLTVARDLLSSFYLKQGDLPKSIEQCRAALRADPKDQEAIYRLTQALRKSGQMSEIPGLLKRLADLQQETRTQEETRSRYKLVEPHSAADTANPQ